VGILTGVTDVIEAAWQKVLTDADAAAGRVGTPLSESFAALVRIAHAEPPLRQLYPVVGMWELHFSRCTEYPHTWDVPYIGTLGDGRYYVEGPSRDSPRIAEPGEASSAVAMVVERLPPGCGPALRGTAADLAAHEDARDTR
jgi:hypothetical protein